MITRLDDSPCLTCTKQHESEYCANHGCLAWSEWFVASWDRLRMEIFRIATQGQIDRDAITVGGFKYSHPDHVRKFLQTKPCDDCEYEEDLCEDPCSTLIVWESMKEKVNGNGLEN